MDGHWLVRARSHVFSYFENLIDPLRESAVEQPPSGTWDFFVHFLRPHWRLMLVTLFFTSVASISELYLYAYLGHILDWMTTTPPEAFFSEHAAGLAFMGFIVVVVRPVSMIIARCLITLTLTPGLTNTVRWQNHRYVVRQSLQYFQSDFAGRVAQKVMQTGNSLRESVLNVLDGVWLLLIYLGGIIWLFLDIDWRLMIPVFFWIIGYGFVILRMMPPVGSKSRAVSEANSALTGRIVDSYTNIQSVKLFAHAEREEAFVASGFVRHTQALRELLKAILKMLVSLVVMNTLLIVSTALLSIYYWQQGTVTIGDIAIANGLILRLNQMSGWILRTISALFEGIGAVQNGIETISVENKVLDSNSAAPLLVADASVEFRSVQFRYDKEDRVIRDFSLRVDAGEKIGIVGRSGAGKSTLVNLLLRFYDVHGGGIFIDGQDISKVTQESLRANIAMVSQDTSLLHRSIRENINYGRPDASEEQILEAARLAQAALFIPELVDNEGRRGYDAKVGERGVKLSGGQRQRIAIARVILKDAPLLVLDEATSALDSEVEAAIQDQLRDLMAGKTVIAIAHRLSTIAAMDRLVVMDKGLIVETGSHDELLKSNGLYSQLWNRQSGGFLGVEDKAVKNS
ncbi:multidrug ABC transporter ATP-binding protein [Chromatiales bacterium (ex Bugula neritina AB1)]|nr:multidrug ABC transporter ATP-binding protein [Chromatiales bacterium (ex Bugula neritina AB1)]